MRALVVLVAALVALAPPLTAALAPAPGAPIELPPPPSIARLDPDGGRTLMLTLDDGEGGVWHEFPVSDAGIATFTSLLADAEVSIDPAFGATQLRGVGAYVHAWSLGGVPYITLGTYFVTTTTGKLRVPVVIVENVSDVDGAAMFAASLVADDAMPIAAEMVPHGYGLVASDGVLTGVVAGLGALIVGALAYALVGTLEATDQSTPAYNLPPGLYAAGKHAAASASRLGFPLIYGQFGIGGMYGFPDQFPEANFTHDWIERPDVRVWTARKVAAGSDVWAGATVSRAGASEGNGVNEFHAWKRVGVGPTTRVNGITQTPAEVYVRADVDRHYVDDGGTDGPTEIVNAMVITVGLATLGEDRPLAQVHMEEERLDSGDEGSGGWFGIQEGTELGIDAGEATYLPEEQHARWSAGVVVDGAYVPLVGAHTDSWHVGHEDLTNLGDKVFEWDCERISGAGVYVAGEYVPLVGARTWAERSPPEFYAVDLALDGPGSQWAGDAEVSVGTFLAGAYVPLAGARVDDDFALHLHPHRTMLSAGTYVDGGYQPLVGATYDGELTLLNWTIAHSNGAPDGKTRWQTSAGAFTLGQYRPVVGTRFVPAVENGDHPAQESYQLGIYPLYYDPFIPVVSVDYDGDAPSPIWALLFVAGLQGSGREGEWDVDLVAYSPGPYAFPLAGVQYRPDAPGESAAYETHVRLGVYDEGGAFVPVVGASFAAERAPIPLLLAQPGALQNQGAGGDDWRASVGYYDPGSGTYVPLVRFDSAVLPFE